MLRPKICLCLTCSTIQENLDILEKYRKWIDMAELRVDCLSSNERLYIRSFPEKANLPVILTIRRSSDGGKFVEGEAARTILFSRALAFADQDIRKNFAYIDLEEDFHVPGLQDAAFAFGTRVIRSFHDMHNPVKNIPKKMASMRTTGYEIPKIAAMPHSLDDVTDMFREAQSIDYEHILCAMGPLGLPTRILSGKIGSFLTYTSPIETAENVEALNHLDPKTLNEVYNFRAIDNDTKIFGITGYPLTTTSSPLIHNAGYRSHGMNAVYIPVRSYTIAEAMTFANQLGMRGLSVTVPHKETVLNELKEISSKTGVIGACNTVLKEDNEWYGYNTDAIGLKKALLEFTGFDNFHRKRIAIIGGGGAARAAALVVKELKGRCCVFNRTVSKCRAIAENYNFKYAPLGIESLNMLEKYSDIIIQTTPLGMGATGPYREVDDPLSFYEFKGTEFVYDVVYHPAQTPMLKRATKKGCQTANGVSMLMYQGYEQFKLFTGEKYE